MRSILTSAIITGSLMLGLPAMADTHFVNAVGSSKSDLATYTGTFDLSGGYTGVSGPISVSIDFSTGVVTADLTIPALTPSIGYPTRRSITRHQGS
jgi:hypothetical protein